MEPFSSLVELLAKRAARPAGRARLYLPVRSRRRGSGPYLSANCMTPPTRSRRGLTRGRPPRRSRAAGVSARPRIHRRLLRMPDRARDRGSHDDAAPAERAGFKCCDHGQLRTGGRAHQCGLCDPRGFAGAIFARGAAMAAGGTGFLACRDDETRTAGARAARHRLPAIHLGLDLRTQGCRRQPRQSARQSGNDPLRARQHQAIDLRQLGAALPRHGTDPEHAGDALCRIAVRTDGAERLHPAAAALAARHP